MNLLNSKLGRILSLSYLGVFLLTGIFGGYFGGLAGIYAIIVTYPWSLIFVNLIDSLGYIAWYDQFAQNGDLALYGFFAMLGLVPPALLNATILYFIGKSFDKTIYKKLPKQHIQ